MRPRKRRRPTLSDERRAELPQGIQDRACECVAKWMDKNGVDLPEEARSDLEWGLFNLVHGVLAAYERWSDENEDDEWEEEEGEEWDEEEGAQRHNATCQQYGKPQPWGYSAP